MGMCEVAPAAQCQEDADCLAAANGVACRPDGAAGMRCDEPPAGFCEEDAQCVGRRTCNQGLCGPDPEVPCEDDWMGRAFASAEAIEATPAVLGNHKADTAAPIGPQTYTGLILCDGRDDWFSVAVPPGERLTVEALWDVTWPGDPLLIVEELPAEQEGARLLHLSAQSDGSPVEYILRVDTVADEAHLGGDDG